nr:uncharacterized protein LOC106848684 isoform X2 [Equus asinus]
MKDLFLSQNQACWQEHIQKEAAARVAWKINYGHKYPKEGPIPGKRLQQAPLRSALGVGPMPVTSSPDSKEAGLCTSRSGIGRSRRRSIHTQSCHPGSTAGMWGAPWRTPGLQLMPGPSPSPRPFTSKIPSSIFHGEQTS